MDYSNGLLTWTTREPSKSASLESHMFDWKAIAEAFKTISLIQWILRCSGLVTHLGYIQWMITNYGLHSIKLKQEAT